MRSNKKKHLILVIGLQINYLKFVKNRVHFVCYVFLCSFFLTFIDYFIRVDNIHVLHKCELVLIGSEYTLYYMLL